VGRARGAGCKRCRGCASGVGLSIAQLCMKPGEGKHRSVSVGPPEGLWVYSLARFSGISRRWKLKSLRLFESYKLIKKKANITPDSGYKN
jgi:hypothetical protein